MAVHGSPETAHCASQARQDFRADLNLGGRDDWARLGHRVRLQLSDPKELSKEEEASSKYDAKYLENNVVIGQIHNMHRIKGVKTLSVQRTLP